MADEERPETQPESETPKELKFTFTPVDSKPSRKYRKGSKYDPVLDAFLAGKEKLSEVSVPGKEANYLRTQFAKRIEATKKYKRISVSVVNNALFLEKK